MVKPHSQHHTTPLWNSNVLTHTNTCFHPEIIAPVRSNQNLTYMHNQNFLSTQPVLHTDPQNHTAMRSHVPTCLLRSVTLRHKITTRGQEPNLQSCPKVISPSTIKPDIATTYNQSLVQNARQRSNNVFN